MFELSNHSSYVDETRGVLPSSRLDSSGTRHERHRGSSNRRHCDPSRSFTGFLKKFFRFSLAGGVVSFSLAGGVVSVALPPRAFPLPSLSSAVEETHSEISQVPSPSRTSVGVPLSLKETSEKLEMLDASYKNLG